MTAGAGAAISAAAALGVALGQVRRPRVAIGPDARAVLEYDAQLRVRGTPERMRFQRLRLDAILACAGADDLRARVAAAGALHVEVLGEIALAARAARVAGSGKVADSALNTCTFALRALGVAGEPAHVAAAARASGYTLHAGTPPEAALRLLESCGLAVAHRAGDPTSSDALRRGYLPIACIDADALTGASEDVGRRMFAAVVAVVLSEEQGVIARVLHDPTRGALRVLTETAFTRAWDHGRWLWTATQPIESRAADGIDRERPVSLRARLRAGLAAHRRTLCEVPAEAWIGPPVPVIDGAGPGLVAPVCTVGSSGSPGAPRWELRLDTRGDVKVEPIATSHATPAMGPVDRDGLSTEELRASEAELWSHVEAFWPPSGPVAEEHVKAIERLLCSLCPAALGPWYRETGSAWHRLHAPDGTASRARQSARSEDPA